MKSNDAPPEESSLVSDGFDCDEVVSSAVDVSYTVSVSSAALVSVLGGEVSAVSEEDVGVDVVDSELLSELWGAESPGKLVVFESFGLPIR